MQKLVKLSNVSTTSVAEDYFKASLKDVLASLPT